MKKIFCLFATLITSQANLSTGFGITLAWGETLTVSTKSLVGQLKADEKLLTKLLNDKAAFMLDAKAKAAIVDSDKFAIEALDKKYSFLTNVEVLQEVFSNPGERAVLDLLLKDFDLVSKDDFVKLSNSLIKKAQNLDLNGVYRRGAACSDPKLTAYGFETALVPVAKEDIESFRNIEARPSGELRNDTEALAKKLSHLKTLPKFSLSAANLNSLSENDARYLALFLHDMEDYSAKKDETWPPAKKKLFDSLLAFNQKNGSVELLENKTWKLPYENFSPESKTSLANLLDKISKDRKYPTITLRKKALAQLFEDLASKGDDNAKLQLKSLKEANCYGIY